MGLRIRSRDLKICLAQGGRWLRAHCWRCPCLSRLRRSRWRSDAEPMRLSPSLRHHAAGLRYRLPSWCLSPCLCRCLVRGRDPRNPVLLGFPWLLGPAPRFGFVALEFVSDRGQHALPQVLRNGEPLNPDRLPGRDGRSGNTAGKRRSAAVICHAATPGARARANACVDSGTHIARSIQPKSQFVMGKLPKVPDCPGGCSA